jgi:protein-L-isoaspartate(D-aspartate) O-methyltransferase
MRKVSLYMLAAGLCGALVFGGPRPALAQTGLIMKRAREAMVDKHVVGAGIKHAGVIKSMRITRRHEFVPLPLRKNAYLDMALPIGDSQTISPPFIVAYMTEQLDPQSRDKVLEIGTGSGYQAAVLSPLVKEVYTIEIVRSLGLRAAKTLRKLRYNNVHAKVGDGYKGWPDAAPFDKIIVTCSPEKVPAALVEQLKEGGRMVVPVGERYQQTMYLFTKKNGKLVADALRPTLFVPMTGAAESRRKVKPDPLNPAAYNGGFEELTGETKNPTGWHYQRQMALVVGDAPEGKQYVTITNEHPGRDAGALQGLAVDGRKVKELEISVHVRTKNVRTGKRLSELPKVTILFYDKKRKPLGSVWAGPWSGTFDWEQKVKRLKVPIQAREGIVRIGMHGGVGELSLDNLQIKQPEKSK